MPTASERTDPTALLVAVLAGGLVGAAGSSVATFVLMQSAAKEVALRQVLTRLEASTELNKNEITRLKDLINKLLLDVNQDSVERFLAIVPPDKRAELLKEYLAIRDRYNATMNNLVTEITGDVDALASKLATQLATMDDDFRSRTDEIRKVVQEMRDDLASFSALLTDITALRRAVADMLAKSAAINDTLDGIHGRVRDIDGEMRRSKAAATAMLVAGSLIGLLGNMIAPALLQLLPGLGARLGILIFTVSMLACLFLWIARVASRDDHSA